MKVKDGKDYIRVILQSARYFSYSTIVFARLARKSDKHWAICG